MEANKNDNYSARDVIYTYNDDEGTEHTENCIYNADNGGYEFYVQGSETEVIGRFWKLFGLTIDSPNCTAALRFDPEGTSADPTHGGSSPTYQVKNGVKVTVALTPDRGYALASDPLSFKDGENNQVNVTVTKVDERHYSFDMPTENVTMTVVCLTEWQALKAALAAGGTVIATDYDYDRNGSITAENGDTALEIPADVTASLNLKGVAIDRGLANGSANDGGNVLTVNGKLALRDTNPQKRHTSGLSNGGLITGGNNTSDGGGVMVYGGTFNLLGGSITGNTANSSSGGGVYVYNSGEFAMSGGKIFGNNASGNGGGVYVEGGTFSMNGGTISGNTAKAGGGGVCVQNIGSFRMNKDTTNIAAGTISGNTAENGGGVYVIGSTFNMSDGTISGNTAKKGNGGGVYVNGTLYISGAPVITGNKQGATVTDSGLDGGTDNNVYLPSGKTIVITDPLTDGVSIGVTTQIVPSPENGVVRITSGLEGKGDFSAFASDNTDYIVGWNDEGTEAVLGLDVVQSADGYTGSYDGTAHGITVKVTEPASGYTIRYIGKASPTVHAIAGAVTGNNCNAKAVTVRKKNLTVKVGKRKKIKATVKGVKKGKKRLKVLKHVAKLRYYSSDCSIATVDSKGRVKGVGKGSCVVYVVANNGVHNEVNVTVK